MYYEFITYTLTLTPNKRIESRCHIMKTKRNNCTKFIKLPDFLIHDDNYCGLPNDAKILYSLLLNRSALSEKTGWKDEQGVYIIFTRENMAKEVGCSLRKVSYLVKELRLKNLIKEKRRGLNKPNHIYVQQPNDEKVYQPIAKSKNILQKPNVSGCAKSACIEKQVLQPIKTEKDLNLYSFIENRFLNTNKKIEQLFEQQEKLKNNLYKNNQKQSSCYSDSNQKNTCDIQSLLHFF